MTLFPPIWKTRLLRPGCLVLSNTTPDLRKATKSTMTKSASEGEGPVPATRSATAMPAVRVKSGCFFGGEDADAGAGAGAGDALDGSLE